VIALPSAHDLKPYWVCFTTVTSWIRPQAPPVSSANFPLAHRMGMPLKAVDQCMWRLPLMPLHRQTSSTNPAYMLL